MSQLGLAAAAAAASYFLSKLITATSGKDTMKTSQRLIDSHGQGNGEARKQSTLQLRLSNKPEIQNSNFRGTLNPLKVPIKKASHNRN